MTLSVAAIPDDAEADTLDFTQAHMTALFQAGEAQAMAGRAFERRVAPSEARPSPRRRTDQAPRVVIGPPGG